MTAATASAEPIVSAVGLTKIFRDFWGRPRARAVNGIDLEIRAGQVFGLLGPNGAGKSTTVKMLLGLLYPSRGSLRIFDRSPTDTAVKRRIGYLPEESYLYKYLTALETLDFFAALFEIHKEERRRRCEQLLDMVGLGAAKHRPVGEFSKGMARRIGLAQALINDPELVILDEPTSGLDPIGCREVKDLIRLLAARDKTVILCSHLLADVEDLCDEVVVLYGGRVQVRGPLHQLLAIGDRTRIQLPHLEPAVLERVLATLNAAVAGAGPVVVDQPTMDLESFFLDVVHRAQAANTETAGARQAGRVADYLRTPPAASGDALLQALARDEAPAPAAAPLPAPPPAVQTAKLTALADEPAPATDSAPPPVPAATRAAELKNASAKLQDLLGTRDTPR